MEKKAAFLTTKSQSIFYRIGLLIISSLLGLILNTLILYRQPSPNGGNFSGLLIQVCLYLLPGSLLAIYISRKLSSKFKLFAAIKTFHVSKLGAYLTVFLMLILLIFPISKFIENEILLLVTIIVSYSFSMVLYYFLAKSFT